MEIEAQEPTKGIATEAECLAACIRARDHYYEEAAKLRKEAAKLRKVLRDLLIEAEHMSRELRASGGGCACPVAMGAARDALDG